MLNYPCLSKYTIDYIYRLIQSESGASTLVSFSSSLTLTQILIRPNFPEPGELNNIPIFFAPKKCRAMNQRTQRFSMSENPMNDWISLRLCGLAGKNGFHQVYFQLTDDFRNAR